ncbi:unnamed protein product [Nesidiocoris tenuis]|uniref:Uncharacterized protein n=1 Tax=Nesidiocoris tenuis TaxID=355587 RepID=A0A6H5G9K8_9HEMI|nr:unnamed protein product [Nesidiocoris tenuis]
MFQKTGVFLFWVVAHPHHAHHEHHDHHGGAGGGGGDSYSSGWGRSIEVAPKSASIGSDPHTLAYKAHAQ